MLKGSRYLLLFAAFIVGLGLVTGVEDVDAASVTSVTISTPSDSGALRGIDSIFVATATVFDVSVPDSLAVIMYLVTTNDSTVVTEAAAQNNGAFGAMSQLSTVQNAANNNITHIGAQQLLNADGGSQLNSGSAQGLVAVRKTLKMATGETAATAGKAFTGDADSVIATATSTGATFTWHGKLDVQVGTVKKVRVAAFALDEATSGSGTLDDTSAVKVSAASQDMHFDADRPVGPATFANADGSWTNDYKLKTTAIHRKNGRTGVADFTGGAKEILGIGDSVSIRMTMGGTADALLLSDSLSVVADLFGKSFAMSKTARAGDTLQYRLELSEGLFGAGTLGAFTGQNNTYSDTFQIFYVDKAGNRSGTTIDAAAGGVTASVKFLVDTKAPKLDGQVVVGDTILPVSTDTITDGTLNSNTPAHPAGFPHDVNLVQWDLPEALDSLFITFDGTEVDVSVVIPGKKSDAQTITTDGALLRNDGGNDKAERRTLDFTQLGDWGTGATSDSLFVANAGTVPSGYDYSGTDAKVTYTYATGFTKDSLVTGVYTVKFKGKDFGGNLGPEVARTGVYIDVDDVQLVRLFPTKAAFGDITAARQDTIEEETSKVIFKLSEPADSVLIVYEGVSGPDDGKSRTRRLSGTELTNTASEQTFQVDSLKNGTEYHLAVLARDLAGNFTRSRVDTFLYDTSFVVPVIKRFTIKGVTGESGLAAASHRIAGDKTVLTLQADASTNSSREAVTYKAEATLKVTGAKGVKITGMGVTDATGGTATLSAIDWVQGSRTVTLQDTASIDTLTVTVTDAASAGGPYTGTLDSVIVYDPGKFSQVVVNAPATATQGTAFHVGLALGDKYKNTRVLDTRYVTVSANKLGVEVPAGDILLKKGTGGFWAKSTGFVGNDLVFTARNLVTTESDGSHDDIDTADKGDNFIDGQSDSVNVSGVAAVTIDAPDTLIAADYKGADGSGDQGGFVMLTFDNSANHETLTAYRIWREVNVGYRTSTAADSTTAAVVALTTPDSAYVPWAKVDAVPGVTLNNVIVATLDNIGTRWAISAESGRTTTASVTAKEAFGELATVGTPYGLMAETMAQSKKAAVQVEGPVFANLTPEALAYVEKGIALRLKDNESKTVSSIRTYTEGAIRAIDNIAPEPVAFLRAVDSPSDAGSSITLMWSKSESDRMLPRFAAGAVGHGTVGDQVAGVKGYNIYRKVGEGAFGLVGKASSGETSFTDLSAFNGIRYTYSVTPYDEDNMATGNFERSAMAIRNNVVDKAGKPLFGLFGADNRIGFDDFFIFSDNFGLDAGSEHFEPAFDLSPNNKIDFDDFFVFVDNFGRSTDASGKVVPLTAGLNSEASLYLAAPAELARVGEEMAIEVDLSDFVEVKGYGFTVNYEAENLEFVKVVSEASLLGETELAEPRVIAKTEGAVSIAAYGQTVDKGQLDVNLIFRSTADIEDGRLYVSEGQLRDGNYAVNQIARLGEVQIQTRPEAFALANNYPNPFNPETTIKYALSDPADVRLEIFNMLGQQVRTLVGEPQNAGRYTVKWDATDESGQALSTGIYFYRIVAGDFHKVEKMLLLK